MFEKLNFLLNKTLHFPHLHSRFYDICLLLKLIKFYTEDNISILLENIKSNFYQSQSARIDLIYMGLIEFKLKLFDQCIYHMLKGNQEYIQKSIVTPFLSYSRSVPFWLGKSIGDFPKNNANILSKVKEYPCILVAANNKYILKFIDRYIDSITIDSNIDFYIYWIDDEPETSNQVREKLSIISDKYSAGKFFIEYEKCPAFFDIRSYFACKRFIFVKKILKERVFAIITDIDYLVKGDLKRFINEIENNRYDVFVKLNNNNISSFFPWLKVTAGTFVVKNSSIGRYFIELFIFIFHQTFNPHGFNWGIDQNILTCLVELFDSMKCIGNLLEIYEPFTVPYDIKLNV